MIVLDTHAWLWWRDAPDRLSAAVREAIDEAEGIGVCTISAWELATLVRRRRIALDRDVTAWVRQALAHARVTVLPLTAEVAVEAGSLPDDIPGDPVDRIIYATARRERARLATRDAGLRAHDPRLTLW